jgi:hypothetical protein
MQAPVAHPLVEVILRDVHVKREVRLVAVDDASVPSIVCLPEVCIPMLFTARHKWGSVLSEVSGVRRLLAVSSGFVMFDDDLLSPMR